MKGSNENDWASRASPYLPMGDTKKCVAVEPYSPTHLSLGHYVKREPWRFNKSTIFIAGVEESHTQSNNIEAIWKKKQIFMTGKIAL